MLRRISRSLRSRGSRQKVQNQKKEYPDLVHGWQPVRPVDEIGSDGEILRLEICIGCKAKRRTAYHSDGRVQVVATDPDPLPLFCAVPFDTLGQVIKRRASPGRR